jgi:hypothetical protein
VVVGAVHSGGVLRGGGAADDACFIRFPPASASGATMSGGMWGWDIINFVWWVGVAHAGTLISAMLFLTRQHWRTAIGRAAEAMTVFAVMMAGLYPAIHVGRAWFDWFMFPIPNHQRHVAAIPVAAHVGRVRGQHLPGRFLAVLVHGHDSRFRRAARPGPDPGAEIPSRPVRAGLDRLGRQWHNYEKAYLVLPAWRRCWCSP